jgi:hypothetical protein
MSSQDNIFNVQSLKAQKARILATERVGTPVILFHDGEKIAHEFTDKRPISNFPLSSGEPKDAPVVIYEFPVLNPPYGLYVAGVDPYRQGKSAYSNSLGAVYIYKRMHEINSDKYQDMFVASYVARPDKKEDWEEQARLLIKYYNARTLCENDELSFINYMISKGDASYLEVQPDWLKEITPNTTQKRDYGISRSAEKVRTFLHGCLKKYAEEVIHREFDANGSVTKEEIGVKRILDALLLEEMIQFNDEGNYDRIIAAELAIAQAMKMDPIFGAIKEEIKNPYPKRTNKSKMFSNSSNLFRNGKSKLFS